MSNFGKDPITFRCQITGYHDTDVITFELACRNSPIIENKVGADFGEKHGDFRQQHPCSLKIQNKYFLSLYI